MSLESIKLLLEKNNFDFYFLNEVDSTMLEIKNISSDKNICLMANSQRKGIGRRGASWISPKGNVYISILLKNILDIKHHFLNTAYTANIICDVLDEVCSIKSEIKWPNDILINDKKICGIISEINNCNNIVSVNTGLGINIVSSPMVDEYKTSSVNEFNKNIDNIQFVYQLMRKYLNNLNLLETNSSLIISKYKSRLKYFKKNIRIKEDNSNIKNGIFYNLKEDGSIILKTISSSENIYNARIII